MEAVGIIDALVARAIEVLPSIEGRAAGFPYLPSEKRVLEHFDEYPFCIIIATGISRSDRSTTDTRLNFGQATYCREFDITLFVDPETPGQAESSAPFENMQDLVIEYFNNFLAAGWRCDVTAGETVITTESVCAYALRISAYAVYDSSCIEPIPPNPGQPLVGIDLKGTLS
jgi:hypothetical protein